jgi:hypothetical protein
MGASPIAFDPRPHLDKLEALVDVEQQRRAEARQLAALNFDPLDRRPTIVTCRADWSHTQEDWAPGWPQIPYGEAFTDPAKMLISELARVYEGALLRDDRVFTIRTNYGLVLITSIVGAEYWQEGDNMPWPMPVESLEAVRAVIDRGMPDLNQGLGRQVWETEAYFRETLAQYPKLAQTVHIGCPDPQGPFNLATNLAGAAIYLATLEEPDIVHAVLDFFVPIYIAVIEKHKQVVGEAPEAGYTFSCRLRGGGRIVDDTGVMLSRDMYREFCVPRNTRIATALSGSLGHFCGKGTHFYEDLVNTPGITSLNFGQPELHNLAERYAVAQPHKVCLMWDGAVPPEAEHITTGIIHRQVVSTWPEAQSKARQLFGTEI